MDMKRAADISWSEPVWVGPIRTQNFHAGWFPKIRVSMVTDGLKSDEASSSSSSSSLQLAATAPPGVGVILLRPPAMFPGRAAEGSADPQAPPPAVAPPPQVWEQVSWPSGASCWLERKPCSSRRTEWRNEAALTAGWLSVPAVRCRGPAHLWRGRRFEGRSLSGLRGKKHWRH